MNTENHPLEQRKIVYSNPDADLPVYYANNASIQVSNLDVRFIFGHIQEVRGQEVSVRNNFTLFMSLEHAKTFAAQLTTLLNRMNEALSEPAKAD